MKQLTAPSGPGETHSGELFKITKVLHQGDPCCRTERVGRWGETFKVASCVEVDLNTEVLNKKNALHNRIEVNGLTLTFKREEYMKTIYEGRCRDRGNTCREDYRTYTAEIPRSAYGWSRNGAIFTNLLAKGTTSELTKCQNNFIFKEIVGKSHSLFLRDARMDQQYYRCRYLLTKH